MFKPALKFIGYALLFMALLEIFARAEDSVRWGAPFLGHYHLEGIRAVDSRGTVRCAEQARYKHFELGEHGFRKTLRSGGDQTFVWLGSSEAFGLYESPGEDVANQLERALYEAGQKIDVINASCFGLNLTRMQRLLEDPLADMPADYVALYPTPHFYLDDRQVDFDEPASEPAGALSARPVMVSRVVTKSRDVIKSFLPQALTDSLRRLQIRRALRGTPGDWLWDDPPAERLALFEQHMRSMLETAIASGATVAVLTHANVFHRQPQLDQSMLQAWRKFYPRATDDVLIRFDRQANAIVRSLAAEYGVSLLDVAERVAGDTAYFADFSHFTDSGARLVAAELASWVKSQAAQPLATQ